MFLATHAVKRVKKKKEGKKKHQLSQTTMKHGQQTGKSGAERKKGKVVWEVNGAAEKICKNRESDGR